MGPSKTITGAHVPFLPLYSAPTSSRRKPITNVEWLFFLNIWKPSAPAQHQPMTKAVPCYGQFMLEHKHETTIMRETGKESPSAYSPASAADLRLLQTKLVAASMLRKYLALPTSSGSCRSGGWGASHAFWNDSSAKKVCKTWCRPKSQPRRAYTTELPAPRCRRITGYTRCQHTPDT